MIDDASDSEALSLSEALIYNYTCSDESLEVADLQMVKLFSFCWQQPPSWKLIRIWFRGSSVRIRQQLKKFKKTRGGCNEITNLIRTGGALYSFYFYFLSL